MKSQVSQKFKALFEAQKASLACTQKYLSEEFAVKSEELADEMDLTSAEQEQDMRMKLRAREFLFIKKIDEALNRIQAGTFGVCETCEDDIELNRLEVRPTATLCIGCKEAEELQESRTADLRIA